MPELEKEFIEELAREWDESWPAPIVPQTEIKKFTGGLMANQTFLNLCSKGEGPPKFYLKRKAVIRKKVLIDWLLQQFHPGYEGVDLNKVGA